MKVKLYRTMTPIIFPLVSLDNLLLILVSIKISNFAIMEIAKVHKEIKTGRTNIISNIDIIANITFFL